MKTNPELFYLKTLLKESPDFHVVLIDPHQELFNLFCDDSDDEGPEDSDLP